MSIIIFIIILGILIFVHELGHFLLAKKNGIKVTEFSIGFPPRILSFKKGETQYTLGLIPFGGYVKIFGENPDEESTNPERKDSFVNKSVFVQALVLLGGVTFNILFAWFLFFLVLMMGMPAVVTSENVNDVQNAKIVITSVYSNSPAEIAGLKSGDVIVSIENEANSVQGEDLSTEAIQEIVENSKEKIFLEIEKSGENQTLEISPTLGILGNAKAIGISMDKIGERKLTMPAAFVESFKMTGNGLQGVFVGLSSLFGSLFSNWSNLNQVSGPIGIVGLVSDASQFGIANLMSFTAVLSINLAVLNVMPFPALDGGRLLFLLLETLSRKKIRPIIFNIINGIGFFILITFMVIISISDIIKLF